MPQGCRERESQTPLAPSVAETPKIAWESRARVQEAELATSGPEPVAERLLKLARANRRSRVPEAE